MKDVVLINGTKNRSLVAQKNKGKRTMYGGRLARKTMGGRLTEDTRRKAGDAGWATKKNVNDTDHLRTKTPINEKKTNAYANRNGKKGKE